MNEHDRVLAYRLTVAFGCYATLLRRLGVRHPFIHVLQSRDLTT